MQRVIKSLFFEIVVVFLYCQRPSCPLLYTGIFLSKQCQISDSSYVLVYLGGTQNLDFFLFLSSSFCCVRFSSERDTHHFVWCVLVCKNTTLRKIYVISRVLSYLCNPPFSVTRFKGLLLFVVPGNAGFQQGFLFCFFFWV